MATIVECQFQRDSWKTSWSL